MDMLILPGGSELTAIASLTLTRSLNDGQELALGSACAAMVEAVLYGEEPPVRVGQELRYVRNGRELGLFSCQQVSRAGSVTWQLTLYDRMIRFDRDVSAWFSGLSRPLTLEQLLDGLCAHCGVERGDTGALPGGDLPVPQFTASALSGRELLRFIGQAAGRMFCMDAQGRLTARWYTPAEQTLGEDIPYQADSLRCAEYRCAAIERVQIRSTESDVGAVWPDGSGAEANTYIIQGNPLLAAGQSADLQAVAQRLYGQLKDYGCTPFQCSLFGWELEPGQSVYLTDSEGNRVSSPVMSAVAGPGGVRISAVGSRSLQSTAAFNRLTLGDLRGRVLTVERDIRGLRVENSDLSGGLAALEMNLQGISTRVEAVRDEAKDHAQASAVSALEQRAESLSLSLTQLREQTGEKADREELEQITEHFLFDADGLTISNTATGMGIGISQERVIFTGGQDPTTQIYPNRMHTTNLQVQSRLDVGGFSLIPRTNGNLSLRYTGS